MKVTTDSIMLRSWRKPAKLFSDFNTLQFASVMGLVVFVMLLVFFPWVIPFKEFVSVDLPKVLHPVSMPGADREDAIIVSVTRDGRVYLGAEQVNAADLPLKIADRLKDHSVERKVYIKADMRARWGGVKQVLDAVHTAGILRVAFLAYQRQPVLTHL
jgi:biopolymer transport protein TolR